MNAFERMREWRNALAHAADLRGEKMFMDKPDAWFADPHFFCVNGHVSGNILRCEEDGDCCLACMQSVILGPPMGEAQFANIAKSFKRRAAEEFLQSSGRVDPLSEEERERFREHARVAHEATSFDSHHRRLVSHPEYKKMKAYGLRAVPFLIELLRDPKAIMGGWTYVLLLEEITAARPWEPQSAGRIREISDSWVRWYDNLLQSE